jgi:hypothetical protein
MQSGNKHRQAELVALIVAIANAIVAIITALKH